MNCPNCNAPLDSDSRFCENCGTPVAAPKAAPMEEMLAPAISTKNKSSKIKWIVLIVVGVLIIAGISVGLYFKMQADKKVEAYSEQISLGEKYLEELKYDDAIIAFTKAIEIEPKKEKPYFALVDVYIDIKDTEKANEIIAQIETLFPENVDVVDKQEEVAVIVEEIKVEEEKKKAEEEAAKKAKELRWLVEPTFEIEYLLPVYRYKYLMPPMSKGKYDSVVFAADEVEEDRVKGKCGVIDYTGKIVVPLGTASISFVGFPCQPRVDGIPGRIYNVDGSLGIGAGEGGYLTAAYTLDTDSLDEHADMWDAEKAGAVRAVQNSQAYHEAKKYVLLDANATRLTQDVYEDGYLFTENLAGLCKDGKWGFLNTTGQEIIPFEYDDAYYFQGGLAAVCKADKWGYIKPDGTVQKDFQFEQALPPYEGKAWVKYNGKWGVLDVTADGSAVLPEATVTPEPEAEIPPEGLTEDQAVQLVKNYLALVSPEVKFSYMIQNEEENFMIKAFEDMGTHITGQWYRVNKKTGELINGITGKTIN